MAEQLLFSIITINYNDEEGLTRTLLSALEQTYTAFQYIVIDGGSTDNCKAIIEKHTDRIDYWISEPDNGVYDAMNKGLKQVNGRYVFFLNSGDTLYSETTLFEMANHLKINNLPDIIYGDVAFVNPETNIKTISRFNVDKISLYSKMICHQAMFCNSNLFKTIGDFDTSFKIKADYDWFLRAVFHGATLIKVNQIVANYEEGGLSETHYDKYSVKEIPVIRARYYTAKEQSFIRRFFLHPQIVSLPFYKIYRKSLLSIVQLTKPKFK